MGVLNVTPDSFSDGGQFAVGRRRRRPRRGHGRRGGRPDRRRRRIDPARVAARRRGRADPAGRAGRCGRSAAAPAQITLSIDTTRAAVAEPRSTPGATSSTTSPPAATTPRCCRSPPARRCPVILMHMQGTPATMQLDPTLLGRDRRGRRRSCGTGWPRQTRRASSRREVLLDPGIGFGKTVGAQPRAAPRQSRDLADAARPAAGDRHQPQGVHRQGHRRSRADRRPPLRHRRHRRLGGRQRSGGGPCP